MIITWVLLHSLKASRGSCSSMLTVVAPLWHVTLLNTVWRERTSESSGLFLYCRLPSKSGQSSSFEGVHQLKISSVILIS